MYMQQEQENCQKNTRLIVLTGGPGGGKTAVLEMAKKTLAHNTVVLPEAASIIFGGGFWRLPSISAKTAAQRAIFHVQREMETLVCEEKNWDVGLCDRGTLDGLAYWPCEEKHFWNMANSTLELELSRYYAVIHLRTPDETSGYNHANPLRTETAIQSKIIDEKISSIWKGHPRYVEVPSTHTFIEKADMALGFIKKFQIL